MSSKSITANPSIMKVVDQSIIFQHNPSLDQVERNISWVKEVPKIQLFSNGTIATLDGTMDGNPGPDPSSVVYGCVID